MRISRFRNGVVVVVGLPCAPHVKEEEDTKMEERAEKL